jgi:peptide/nickel transport system permease protein
MLRVRELPFVAAARAAGIAPVRVWYRHALPHACRPLLATAPLSLAGLIGLESTLAFLGVGRSPDIPSWGNLLGTLQQEPGAWWILASAGGALILTLVALQQLARQVSKRS